jgi:hypothetical protein
LDASTVEHADVYLTHAYGASPCELVWLDDDGLERQEPMFQVRQWDRRDQLAIADESKRPDGHLLSQLRFVAQLFEIEDVERGLGEAAKRLKMLESALLPTVTGRRRLDLSRLARRRPHGLAVTAPPRPG